VGYLPALTRAARRSRGLLSLLLLALGPLAAGCASFTALGPARTIDEGEAQFYLAGELMRVKRGGQPLSSPQVEIGGRYGLTENVELGARIWLPNVAADVKVQLLRSPTPDWGLDLALDPSLGYLGGFSGSTEDYTDTLHVITLALPLLAGWNLGHGLQALGSVRVVDQVWTGDGDAATTANLVFLGGSLGLVWKITDGVRIVPEVAFASPMVQSLADFGTHVGPGGTVLQVALGLLLGGDATPIPTLQCPQAPAATTP